ncbi:hypothetical protein D3C81_919830 [compost metagenome]
MAVRQGQRLRKQRHATDVVAHEMGGGNQSYPLAHLPVQYVPQPGGILLAAQRVHQQHLVSVDEGGSDRFNLVTDEHQHIWGKLLNSHGGLSGWEDRHHHQLMRHPANE